MSGTAITAIRQLPLDTLVVDRLIGGRIKFAHVDLRFEGITRLGRITGIIPAIATAADGAVVVGSIDPFAEGKAVIPVGGERVAQLAARAGILNLVLRARDAKARIGGIKPFADYRPIA
jgi:hypothetical protein